MMERTVNTSVGRTKAGDFAPGSVWIVGAGPGDPDLLTRKAESLLKAADVVFHDALVGLGILNLVPARTRKVSVGKRSGRHSKDQRSINQMLVEAAFAGARVVRLKGGDPSVFGRSAEEIAFLSAHGIAARVCPGITTACAAAATAGASLTLRGKARRLTFVTAHAQAGEALDLDWKGLAAPGQSLAIYMGRESADEISRQLMAAGLPGETPVLVAANVSLPDERMIRTRLDAMAFAVRVISGTAPTMLLVGESFANVTEEAPLSGDLLPRQFQRI
jgi:uroporphyrin-III C-methyltransferase